MLHVKLFNVLLELKSNIQGAANKQEMLDDYKERVTDIIKASKPAIKNPSKIDENFNKFLEKMALTSVTNSASTTTSSTVQGLSGITEGWLGQLHLGNSGMLSAVGKLFNELFDFRAPVVNKVYDEDLKKTLPKVLAKHVVCLFNAFKVLNNFSNDQKHTIVNEFVKVITLPIAQGGQGWVRGVTSGGQPGMLSLTEVALQFMQFQRESCAFRGVSAAEGPAVPGDDEPDMSLKLQK